MIRPIAYHPDLLPPFADEAGSARYECEIMYVKLPDRQYSCKHYDLIADEGVFIAMERSPDYCKPVEVDYKSGVVVKSKNGTYSWWYHLSRKMCK